MVMPKAGPEDNRGYNCFRLIFSLFHIINKTETPRGTIVASGGIFFRAIAECKSGANAKLANADETHTMLNNNI